MELLDLMIWIFAKRIFIHSICPNDAITITLSIQEWQINQKKVKKKYAQIYIEEKQISYNIAVRAVGFVGFDDFESILDF